MRKEDWYRFVAFDRQTCGVAILHETPQAFHLSLCGRDFWIAKSITWQDEGSFYIVRWAFRRNVPASLLDEAVKEKGKVKLFKL